MVTHCRIAVHADALREMEQLEALGAVRWKDCPVYDLNDTQPHFDEILKLLENTEKARVTIFWHTYSEKERSQAGYLHVRSTYAGLESFFFHPECYELLHYYDTPYWRGR